LGGAALLNVGTGAGDVAAGNAKPATAGAADTAAALAANQGTTTTVLHGAASGTPGFAAVTPSDFGVQNANKVLAGPVTGADATPTYRALVSADIPANAANTSGKATTAGTADTVTSISAHASTELSDGSTLRPFTRTGTVISPTNAGDSQAIGNTFPDGTGRGAVLNATKGVLDGGGQVYNVQTYGILPDNIDHSAIFATLLTTVYTAGGGWIYFPPTTPANKYRFNTCGTIPNDGQSLPSQPTIRIFGAGGSANSAEVSNESPYGSSILDVRCTTGTAFIDTRGKGFIEVDHLAYTNGLTGLSSTIPFFQTTNTVSYVHDNTILGPMDTAGTTSIQEGIVLGGTTTNFDGTATSAFQGYGTTIERNHFNRVRTGVHGRTYANGLIIQNNIWWNECGSADPLRGAIVFDGTPVVDSGAQILGNLIETYAYPASITMIESLNFTFIGNNFYDPSATTAEYINFDATSCGSNIYEGLSPQTVDPYPPILYKDPSQCNAVVSSTSTLAGTQSRIFQSSDYAAGVGMVENRVTYSNTFSNAAWTKYNVTITANAATGPTGLTNASEATVAAAGHFMVSANLTVLPNTPYLFTVWLKNNGGSQAPHFAVQDVTHGTYLTSGSYTQTLTSGWQRFQQPFFTPAGTVSVAVFPVFNSGTGVDVYLADAQVAAGNYPVPYVETRATGTAPVGASAVDIGYFNQAVVFGAGIPFASLGTPATPRSTWCPDCAIVSTPPSTCTGSSTGAMAFWNGTAWKCPF
jgi:hypothetical protein